MIMAFVALEISSIPGLDPVFAGLSGLSGIKPVRPEQLHMTLKFLGDIEPEQVNGIASAIDSMSAEYPPVQVSVTGLGAFPNPGRPRVLWAGVTPQEPLVALATGIDRIMVGLGFAPDKRPFSPHLTLARFRTPPQGTHIKDMVREYRARRFADLTIKSIKLKKSTLTHAGPIYEDLHTAFLYGEMEA